MSNEYNIMDGYKILEAVNNKIIKQMGEKLLGNNSFSRNELDYIIGNILSEILEMEQEIYIDNQIFDAMNFNGVYTTKQMNMITNKTKEFIESLPDLWQNGI